MSPRWILAAVLVALGPGGCARERREITPATLGTDLRAMPRGRMIPPAFPGTDLARNRAPAPAVDPEAVATSAEAPTRPAIRK